MGNRASYYFGRLNLLTTYEDKHDFLMRGLRSKKPVLVRQILWSFLEIGEIMTDEGQFAYGYLAKSRPLTQEEVAQHELGAIGHTPISNLIVAKSRFFLHVASGVIAFRGMRSQIDINMFRNRFKRVFENEYDNWFVSAEIQMIQEPYKILEVLSRFETITRVHVCLHPSNPNLSPMWEEVDREMKRKGADNYTEIYEAGGKSPTLKIADDKDVRGKIAMAVDGYGRATVRGKLDGKTQEVSTRDNPVSALVPSGDLSPHDVLDSLSLVFRQIFSRFLGK